jgi:hypothetical protein
VFDAVVGCDGACNSGYYYNGCSDCVLASEDNCPLDCAGVPDGLSYYDPCFECVLPGTSECHLGCDGLWGSGDNLAVEDYCDVCNGDDSSCTGCMEPDACNYDSNNLIPDGSCQFPPENYDCDGCIVDLDCAGVCGGTAEVDECGVCGGFGATTWYADYDEDGLGDINNSISSCNPLSGYVSNSNDSEPTCSTNDEYLDCGCGADCGGYFGDCCGDDCDDSDLDCAGDCYGPAEDDVCGICNGNGCYMQDCETYPIELYDCNGCAATVDCEGVCGGSAELDCAVMVVYR